MAQSLSYFDAPRNSIDKIIDKYFLKEFKKKKSVCEINHKSSTYLFFCGVGGFVWDNFLLAF